MNEKTTAIEEQPRPATQSAGEGSSSFRDLLALASIPDADEDIDFEDEDEAPLSEHALLDQFLAEHETPNTCKGGDIDDVLVQLVGRAADATHAQESYSDAGPVDLHTADPAAQYQEWLRRPSVRPKTCLERDTWSAPRTSWLCTPRHLPQRDSLRIVAFIRYGDPGAAREVIHDLLDTNVFATVRTDIANWLVEFALSRPSTPREIRDACAQAVSASDLFGEPKLNRFLEAAYAEEPLIQDDIDARRTPARTGSKTTRGPTGLASNAQAQSEAGTSIQCWRVSIPMPGGWIAAKEETRTSDSLPTANCLKWLRRVTRSTRLAFPVEAMKKAPAEPSPPRLRKWNLLRGGIRTSVGEARIIQGHESL
jgi:hypothetical protein